MNNSNEQNEVVYLYLDDIIPNRFQPRERFDEGALRELAASIKEHGVIQPIIVRKIGDKYEIIAGERRYKASALAGLTTIPAIVRNLDDKETSKVALLENLQRKNLSPIEEARTYQKILDLDQMTQFELAKTMGKSQPVVANKLRLLTLPDEVQEALLKEQISERHARSLLSLQNSEDQISMLHKIINNRMTVRETDEEIRKMSTTDNFNLPGLEANTSNTEISTGENNSQENPTGNQGPTPIQPVDIANIQPQTISEQKEAIEGIKQETVDIPDVNALRKHAVDIKDLNNTISTASEQKSTEQALEATQPIPIVEETIKEQPKSQFMNLEDLLRNSKAVPIREEKKENSVAETEDILATPLEETEEVLESVEEPKETLEVENLEETTEEPVVNLDELIAKVDSKLEEVNPAKDEHSIPEEKPLPSVVDATSTNVFDLRLAISDIRDKIKDLQDKGIKIETEEIDFENQYQIVIKIEK